MALPLSPRLAACCGLIAPGDRVADIGCDHGYLSIHLLQSGIASSVIAADINEMPLRSALRNGEKYGVQEKMKCYLSDGVRNIPRDFDTLVCAGMGADTMISILTAAPWLKAQQYRLVLQCQSKTPVLRQYLSAQGWYLAQETAVRDGRFLYTVMDVRYDPAAPRLTPGGCYLSPALRAVQTPENREYARRTLAGLNRVVTARGEKADPFMCSALQELQEEKYDACE